MVDPTSGGRDPHDSPVPAGADEGGGRDPGRLGVLLIGGLGVVGLILLSVVNA